MRCFSEGWFQEKVFGRVDLNVSNDGVDYALAFRKTLVLRMLGKIRFCENRAIHAQLKQLNWTKREHFSVSH